MCVPTPFEGEGQVFQVSAKNRLVLVTFDLEEMRGGISVSEQFHFHTPSEHTINGKSYPLEVHVVTFPAPFEDWMEILDLVNLKD